VTKATPRPILGAFHQAAIYRIAMNVAQLLDAFALAEDNKIIEPPLPEMTVAAAPISVFDRWGGSDSGERW